jgi:hypothetical protein
MFQLELKFCLPFLFICSKIFVVAEETIFFTRLNKVNYTQS